MLATVTKAIYRPVEGRFAADYQYGGVRGRLEVTERLVNSLERGMRVRGKEIHVWSIRVVGKNTCSSGVGKEKVDPGSSYSI
jgi:hypothetical protein